MRILGRRLTSSGKWDEEASEGGPLAVVGLMPLTTRLLAILLRGGDTCRSSGAGVRKCRLGNERGVRTLESECRRCLERRLDLRLCLRGWVDERWLALR